MIEEYLNDKEKDEEANTDSAFKALQGEKIKKHIGIDEETDLFLMDSENSLILKSDGAYLILSKKKTKEFIENVKENSRKFHQVFEEVESIIPDKQSDNQGGVQ